MVRLQDTDLSFVVPLHVPPVDGGLEGVGFLATGKSVHVYVDRRDSEVVTYRKSLFF